ncbi:MAG: hypothetical protein RIT45_1070 [Pseudomonadota bacterium]|jgi:hypothetical protein
MKTPALAALALTFATTAALALMPPHTSRSDPADGGVLKGRTVVIYGYSLDYADKKAEVRDVTANRAVHAAVEVECKWVGKGDCAGCQQQKCEARITLAETERGHRYTITYLDLTITVQAAETSRARPDAKPPAPTEPEPARPPKDKRGTAPKDVNPGGSGAAPTKPR